jgi:hypothetical protein
MSCAAWFCSIGSVQARCYLLCLMSPFLLLLYTVIFCLVYGGAYGVALTGKVACINRNSAITALVFAVVLWLLNKPFS